MKIRDPRLIRVIAFLISGLLRVWLGTVRVRRVYWNGIKQPTDVDTARHIYGFWHESILSLLKFRSEAPVRVLISKHADGELIAQVCGHLGVDVVRGSTNRGGGAALVELWDCSRRAHLVFTPDGPRGPRRKVQIGMVALASRSGLPVVPVGVAFKDAWRAGSWDRFLVPRPFTRCDCVSGEPIVVPPNLDRDGLESYRLLIESRMLELTEDAERRSRPAGRPPSPFRGPHPRTASADAGKTAS